MRKFILYFVAVFCVVIISCAFMDVSNEESNEEIQVIETEKNYKVFQLGAFIDQDSATTMAAINNSIVINDDKYFCVYKAILSDEELINRLKSYLDKDKINYYIKDITVSDEFKNKIKSIEKEMLKSSSSVAFYALNHKILDIYLEYN